MPSDIDDVARPWFLATCLDCEPTLPQPFSDPDERDVWAIAHRAGTGHTVATVTQERGGGKGVDIR